MDNALCIFLSSWVVRPTEAEATFKTHKQIKELKITPND